MAEINNKAFTLASSLQHNNRMTGSAQTGIIWFRFPGVPKVCCAFTTANYGNLSLDAALIEQEQQKTIMNRSCLQQHLGLEAWAELKQVHGTTSIMPAQATTVGAASPHEADGHATEELQLGLVIKTADCQPILLTHASGQYVAALHVGWRGNSQEFIQKAVAEFCGCYNVHAHDVFAVRGPSLGPSAAQFVNFTEEWAHSFLPWYTPATQTMNLWHLTQHQLQQSGILAGNIFSLDLCTKTLGGLFYSYRLGHSGRQMSVIWKERD